MSNKRALEVNIPNFSAVQRYSYPLAAGETIGIGQWFELNASGEAILSDATTPKNIQFLNFQDSGDPSVSSIQTDNFVTGATPAEIQTGGVVALVGKFNASVDTTGYTGTPSQDDALTSKAGKLVAAGADPVVAYVTKPIGADGRLHFITV
jgi:hypothetical protein